MKTCHDVYTEPEVYHHNNCIVRVYRSILTEEERTRRMEAIKKAAVDLVIATERAKQKRVGRLTNSGCLTIGWYKCWVKSRGGTIKTIKKALHFHL